MLGRSIAAAIAAATLATAAQATVVVYNGTLVNGVAQTGTIATDGNTTLADAPIYGSEKWSYWKFWATAGDNVTAEVNRTSGEFDPVAGIFQGLYISSEDFIPYLDVYGGLAYGDDEDAAAVSGPAGDPLFTFFVPMTGWYTLAIASGINGIDPFASSFGFNVMIDGATGTPVPEPGMIGLLGLGLAGVAMARRRRNTA